MSRNITLMGTYRNNMTSHPVGYHCPKNYDMVPSTYTKKRHEILISKFYSEIGNRKLKHDSIRVNISKSGSESGDSIFMVLTVDKKNLLKIYPMIAAFFEGV